jgi:hypothetical protein
VGLGVELRSPVDGVVGVTGERDDEIGGLLPDVGFDEYPMLAGVDRYGETMFNTQQMPWVAAEAERLAAGATPKLRKFLRELVALCEQGAPRAHMQLWFLGD